MGLILSAAQLIPDVRLLLVQRRFLSSGTLAPVWYEINFTDSPESPTILLIFHTNPLKKGVSAWPAQ